MCRGSSSVIIFVIVIEVSHVEDPEEHGRIVLRWMFG
jgi:hypothetical protein